MSNLLSGTPLRPADVTAYNVTTPSLSAPPTSEVAGVVVAANCCPFLCIISNSSLNFYVTVVAQT